jgi:hypothetical protein
LRSFQFLGVPLIYDPVFATSLINEVNSRIDHVVIDTKELTENITIEMDSELSEVAHQVAAIKEHLEGRVT